MKTWIAAAAALALAAAQDEAGKIDALIQQLGSEDYAAREKATDELRKIGKPAEEALRKAAESTDPEVQSRAKALLKDFDKPKDEAVPRRAPRAVPGFNGLRGGSLSVMSNNNDTTYQVAPGDGSPPFTFRKSADGAVKLDYTDDKGEKKTAGSDSLPKFLKDHKELADRFGIGENGIDYAGLRAGFGQGGMRRAFPFQPGFRFQLDEDNLPARPFADRAAGAAFEKPSDTMRAQLEIPEGQGLVVARVDEGSDAEAAGLRRHDILLEIDGRKAASAADVKERLGTAGSVTVLRKGRKQALQPKAAGKKDF